MEKYIQRIIDIQSKLKNKSLFLFGPRQTGKSSLIANQIQDDVKLSWSLLNARIRRRCQADPGVLRDEIETRGIHDGLVIIDEIQKVPELLDEVHHVLGLGAVCRAQGDGVLAVFILVARDAGGCG